MLETFLEQKALFAMLFLVIMGTVTYYYRQKAWQKETAQQKTMNDFYAVVSVMWAFSFITFAMLFSSEYIWHKSDEVIEIETLQDVQRHLRAHYEDIEAIRKSYNNSVGLMRTFMIVSGAMFPMLIYRIFKESRQNPNKEQL